MSESFFVILSSADLQKLAAPFTGKHIVTAIQHYYNFYLLLGNATNGFFYFYFSVILFHLKPHSLRKSSVKSGQRSHCIQTVILLYVFLCVRLRLRALPERLWDSCQPFLWRGQRGGQRFWHVEQLLPQPHQHVTGRSPEWQRGDSDQWGHRAQVSGQWLTTEPLSS